MYFLPSVHGSFHSRIRLDKGHLGKPNMQHTAQTKLYTQHANTWKVQRSAHAYKRAHHAQYAKSVVLLTAQRIKLVTTSYHDPQK